LKYIANKVADYLRKQQSKTTRPTTLEEEVLVLPDSKENVKVFQMLLRSFAKAIKRQNEKGRFGGASNNEDDGDGVDGDGATTKTARTLGSRLKLPRIPRPSTRNHKTSPNNTVVDPTPAPPMDHIEAPKLEASAAQETNNTLKQAPSMNTTTQTSDSCWKGCFCFLD
jgi:hypothetical protein